MNNLTIDEVLHRYPLCLRDNIEEIWNAELSICPSPVVINLPANKLDPGYRSNLGNSLTLEIPYAGRSLHCEIIFNDEDLTFPPDFDVTNDPFLSDPDVDVIEKNLPSLAAWNIYDPRALLSFVYELIRLYKKHQIEKLHTDSKHVLLQEEYRQLKDELHLDDNDLELLIDNNAQHFLIPIKLDYSELPVYIQETYFEDGRLANPGVDWATLKISFLPHNKCTTALQLSPRLECVFGNFSTLHIPAYKRSGDMLDYVRSLKELVADKTRQIGDRFRLKERYVGALLSRLGGHVVEYDNIGFGRATFLFQVESFHFLAEIGLGNGFPAEKPLLTVRSIYHRDASGEPASMVLKNCQYNSEWGAEEMIEKLIIYIRNDIARFKTYCINNLSQ